MNNRKNLMILAGVAVLSAAFLLLNFRLAYSGTGAETMATTMSSGDQMPDDMQQRQKITLYVQGEGPLAGALRDTLEVKLREAGLGEVEVVQAIDADYPNPVLVVDTGKPSVFWTPIFGTSSVFVEAWYASNGDTTMIDAESVGFDSADGPGMITNTNYQITDNSFGILSRPGYYQVLADWLANSIIEGLRKIYQPKF